MRFIHRSFLPDKDRAVDDVDDAEIQEVLQWVYPTLETPCQALARALLAILALPYSQAEVASSAVVEQMLGRNLHRSIKLLLLLHENQIILPLLRPHLCQNLLSPTLAGGIRAVSIRLAVAGVEGDAEEAVVSAIEKTLEAEPGVNPWEVELACLEALPAEGDRAAAYLLSRDSNRFPEKVRAKARAAVEALGVHSMENVVEDVLQLLRSKEQDLVRIGLCAVQGLSLRSFGGNLRKLFVAVQKRFLQGDAAMQSYCEDAIVSLGQCASAQDVVALVEEEGSEGMEALRIMIQACICSNSAKEGWEEEDFGDLMLALCKCVLSEGQSDIAVLAKWLDVPRQGDERKELEAACKRTANRAFHALSSLQVLLEETVDMAIDVHGRAEIVVCCSAWLGSSQRSSSAYHDIEHETEEPLPWASARCETVATQVLLLLHKKLCGSPEEVEADRGWYAKFVLGRPGILAIREKLGHGNWRKTQWLRTCAVLHAVSVLDLESCQLRPNFLGDLLPVVLPLVDDVDGKCVRLGLRSLMSLQEQVTPTVFRWHGELILSSIDTALASREANTIGLALSCLLRALNMMEPMLRVGSTSAAHHKFMKKGLVYLRLLQDGGLRLQLLRFIKAIARKMKVKSARYLQELLPLLEQNVSGGGQKHRCLRDEAMQVLEVLVKHCWVVCGAYSEQIVVIVLRAHIMASVSEEIASDSADSAQAKEELGRIAEIAELVASLVTKEKLIKTIETVEKAADHEYFATLRSRLQQSIVG